MQRIYYPIILTPHLLQERLQELPAQPEYNSPIPPPFLAPPSPPMRIEFDPLFSPVGVGGFLALTGAIAFFLFPLLGVFLWVLSFIFLLVFPALSIVQQLEAFPAKARKYQQQLQRYRDRQQRQRSRQQTRVQEREDAIARWQTEIQLLLNPVREILSRTRTPGWNSRNRRGYSEAEFESYLRRYFGDRVHTGRTLQNPNYDRDYPYTADFAYIDSSGLHIDIEIDEPYVHNTLQAIHFLGADEERDAFFLSCGWIVLRFAEEQVVRYPDSCCRAIAAIVFPLHGKMLPQTYLQIPALPRIPQWTWQEGVEMAREQYRQKYC